MTHNVDYGGHFAGLSPPYRTVVADPPWRYDEGWPSFIAGKHGSDQAERRRLPYSSLGIDAIAGLPVGELADTDAHLYLWTTNRYLRHAWGVAAAWGFRGTQVLVWCKQPMGLGPGGAFASTTEFVLFARRGSLPAARREPSSWWLWKRQRAHSVKPSAFVDMVERVSPGPYVELFARGAGRLGWDTWGDEAHHGLALSPIGSYGASTP